MDGVQEEEGTRDVGSRLFDYITRAALSSVVGFYLTVTDNGTKVVWISK